MKDKKYIETNTKFLKKDSICKFKDVAYWKNANNSKSKLNKNRNYWSNIDEIIDFYKNH